MDQLKGHALPWVRALGACITSSRRRALVGVVVIWVRLKRSCCFGNTQHARFMVYMPGNATGGGKG